MTTTMTTIPDTGTALQSPSTKLMKLVNIQTPPHDTTTAAADAAATVVPWTDFATITNYLQDHLYDILHEIHCTYDKLLIDDGQVQINCPPLPSPTSVESSSNDGEGSSTSTILLLRTLSELECNKGGGIIAKREIKVYDCGPTATTSTANDTTSNPNFVNHTIFIREDVTRASNNSTLDDNHPTLTEQSITITIPKYNNQRI